MRVEVVLISPSVTPSKVVSACSTKRLGGKEFLFSTLMPLSLSLRPEGREADEGRPAEEAKEGEACLAEDDDLREEGCAEEEDEEAWWMSDKELARTREDGGGGIDPGPAEGAEKGPLEGGAVFLAFRLCGSDLDEGSAEVGGAGKERKGKREMGGNVQV